MASIFKVNSESFSHKLLKIIFTFLLVNIAWIFFRVEDFGQALYMVRHLFDFSPAVLMGGGIYNLGLDRANVSLLFISVMILMLVDIFNYHNISISEKLTRQGIWLRWFVYITAVIVIVTAGIWGPSYNAQGFIYQGF